MKGTKKAEGKVKGRELDIEDILGAPLLCASFALGVIVILIVVYV